MNKKYFIQRIWYLAKKAQVSPFLIAIFILLVISILNKFPKGYIYSYSDFFQFVNFKDALRLKWFSNIFVDYGGGNLNFLYSPFYYSVLGFIQDLIGQQYMASVYCFIFLTGSFYSFYLATFFYGVDRGKNTKMRFCFSLLYALNSYTIIRFGLPSIYFLPYVFIPVLFATTHAYFMRFDVFNRGLIWCAAAMLISTVCWAGPPFFVGYSILTFAYIVLVYIFYRKYSLFYLAKKFISYYFVFISSFVMYFFTWPVMLFAFNAGVQAGRCQVNILEWLYSQSLTMLDVFSFRMRFFGLTNISKFNLMFLIMLTFSLFLLFFGSFLAFKKNKQKKIILIFTSMVFIVIFFLNKGKGFFWEKLVHYLFASNIILSSLRSFDKILIFLPFLLLMPYYIFSIDTKRKVIPLVLLICVLIFGFPFIYGDLYKKHYGVDQGKDYLNSSYAPLVKIPQEYFDIINKTNPIKSDFKILSVPWSLENIDLKGWLISPKWKNKGVNPVMQYFRHPFVQMNEPTSFRGWNYGAIWNSQGNSESFWLMSLSGMLNAKYLIFQKDVSDKFVSQAVSKIDFYKENGFIKSLFSNSYFDFFEISDAYFLPHLYIPDKLHIVNNPSDIPFVLNGICEYSKTAVLELHNMYPDDLMVNDNKIVIEYKKVDSTKYKVKFHGITKSFPFVFSETFYSFWKIYPKHYTENKNYATKKYEVFKYNKNFQATIEELEVYLKESWISELGDSNEKKRKIFSWISFNLPQSYEEKYCIDFVSKKIKGVIQNDNISDGYFYDTWRLKPIDEKFHQIVNGYANYWKIDLEYLKDKFPATLKKNHDGSYDLEVIIEFWPQKALNISKIYGIVFTAFICILLIKIYVFKNSCKLLRVSGKI